MFYKSGKEPPAISLIWCPFAVKEWIMNAIFEVSPSTYM